MESEQDNNKRIAKNTLFLYLRMIVVMLITLYTSRILLEVLGVEDFGVYNAIGGFIAMFAIISSSLSSAIGRFITFELGRDDYKRVKVVFVTAFYIQLIFALIILVVSETIGMWFLEEKMTIPESRMSAAYWVYQLAVVAFVLNILNIPYNALIIAYEKMNVYALISVIETVLKLIFISLLIYSPIDKLVSYSSLICLVALIIRFLYIGYCHRLISIDRNYKYLQFSIFKEMAGFAGWNFIGVSSTVLRDQGVNILFNIFCGPIVNAAQGIAMQLRSAVLAFSSSFTTALNPQITKNYAQGNTVYLWELVFKGAKYSGFLMMLMSLPLLLETDFVLQMWLRVVPDHTVNFVRISLIYILIESFSCTMVTLMLATGQIKMYQIVVGSCQMLVFPLAYIFLKLGYSPEIALFTSCVIAVLNLCLRLMMLHNLVHFPVIIFLRDVVLKMVMVFTITLILPLYVYINFESGFFRFCVNSFLSISLMIISMYTIGCDREEKVFVNSKCRFLINKIKNNF